MRKGGEAQLGVGLGLQTDTLRTVPASLWFTSQAYTAKVEPLDGTVPVVTGNHLTVGYLLAQAIGRLIRIHGHVQHFARVVRECQSQSSSCRDSAKLKG